MDVTRRELANVTRGVSRHSRDSYHLPRSASIYLTCLCYCCNAPVCNPFYTLMIASIKLSWFLIFPTDCNRLFVIYHRLYSYSVFFFLINETALQKLIYPFNNKKSNVLTDYNRLCVIYCSFLFVCFSFHRNCIKITLLLIILKS